MKTEEWRIIKDERIPSKYEISNYGNIRNSETAKIIKLHQTRGYLYTNLTVNKKKVQILVHRLILSTFKPIKNPEKYEVNHINHIRTDNRLENLEWVTTKENNQKREEKVNMKTVEYLLKKYEVDSKTADKIMENIKREVFKTSLLNLNSEGR